MYVYSYVHVYFIVSLSCTCTCTCLISLTLPPRPLPIITISYSYYFLQYQTFVQFRGKLNSRSADEILLLKQNAQVITIMIHGQSGYLSVCLCVYLYSSMILYTVYYINSSRCTCMFVCCMPVQVYTRMLYVRMTVPQQYSTLVFSIFFSDMEYSQCIKHSLLTGRKVEYK